MRTHSRQSWSRLALGLILACLVLFGSLHRVSGQAPGTPAPASAREKKIYTNKPIFHLPVNLAEKYRADLRELCLYSKTPTTDWTKQDSIPPMAAFFTYRVPQDGEYWFAVVTVDMAGKAFPTDVNQAPVKLKVVVDTQAPQIDVKPWTSPDGELFVKCLVYDANPNPEATRLTVRLPGGADKFIEPVAGQPGLYRASTAEMLTMPLLVTAVDQAGNQSTVEVKLKDMLAKNTGASGTGNLPPTVAGIDSVPIPPIQNGGPLPDGKVTIPVTSFKPDVQTGLPTMPDLPPGPPSPVTPVQFTQPPGLPPAIAGVGENQPRPPSSPPPANRKILNTMQANVEFRIDQVGPSGVGKVEVFITSDQGQTWRRLREVADKRSPVDIEFPGEGLFGISVVVTNGNGFGGTAPRAGDAPSFWIEVDTTSPFVQLRPIDPSSANAGMLEISWTASDKNLASEPVSLFYRTRPEGPWQVIAQGLKNDGRHRWAIPRDAGAQFYLKVEVIDQAGNVGRTETPTAIMLDMTEPRGVVLGVTGSPRAAVPQGN